MLLMFKPFSGKIGGIFLLVQQTAFYPTCNIYFSEPKRKRKKMFFMTKL